MEEIKIKGSSYYPKEEAGYRIENYDSDVSKLILHFTEIPEDQNQRYHLNVELTFQYPDPETGANTWHRIQAVAVAHYEIKSGSHTIDLNEYKNDYPELRNNNDAVLIYVVFHLEYADKLKLKYAFS